MHSISKHQCYTTTKPQIVDLVDADNYDIIDTTMRNKQCQAYNKCNKAKNKDKKNREKTPEMIVSATEYMLCQMQHKKLIPHRLVKNTPRDIYFTASSSTHINVLKH